eukprot:gene8604-6040_t
MLQWQSNPKDKEKLKETGVHGSTYADSPRSALGGAEIIGRRSTGQPPMAELRICSASRGWEERKLWFAVVY